MYKGVQALIINKIDLVPYVPFDMDFFRQGVEILNPGLVTFPVSAKTGEGMQAWTDLAMGSGKYQGLMSTKRIFVTGIVQGVGFRPYVYGLAVRHRLSGWVCNTSAGVDIVIQGETAEVEGFVESLSAELPPLARIDSVKIQDEPAGDFAAFEIRESESIAGAFQPISADTAICDDSRARVVRPPHDRRYLYPFINCTNCGPRFTIIKDIPYDRPATTMAEFLLCDACRA